MRWFALTIWERQPSDEGKEFESYVMVGPLKSNPAKFRILTPMHRVMSQIMGFPIRFGEMRLKAYIREVGGEWSVVGDYPLTVQKIAATPPTQSN
jgi:hypothetical protein